MTTEINIRHPFIQCVHNAVLAVYPEATQDKIYSMQDTHVKFFTVFLLSHFYGYSPADITQPYLINRLYVSTVVHRMTELYGVSENFRLKVKTALDFIEQNYEEVDA